MQLSPHMVSGFKPNSKGGTILQKIDEIVKREGPKGIWLEWTPGSNVMHHSNFRLEKTENGNGGIYELTLLVPGERKYRARLGKISAGALERIETFLKQELKGEKPFCENQKEKGGEVMESQRIESQAKEAGASKTNPLRANSANAELVLMAIEDLIKREKIKPAFGWYRIEHFTRKILETITKPEATNKQYAALTLTRILKFLESEGKIEMQKKDRGRSRRIHFPNKDLSPLPEQVSEQKDDTAPLEVQPKTASSAADSIMSALKELRYFDFLRLKDLLKQEPQISQLVKDLIG